MDADVDALLADVDAALALDAEADALLAASAATSDRSIQSPEEVSDSVIEPISLASPEPTWPVTEASDASALVAEPAAAVAELAALVADVDAELAEDDAAVADVDALVA